MAWEIIGNVNTQQWFGDIEIPKYKYRLRNMSETETRNYDFSAYHSSAVFLGTRTVSPGGTYDVGLMLGQSYNSRAIIKVSSGGNSPTTYLERELTNTAPTTPGAFTQPNGTLKGGDSVPVTWGASTDADGNSITYYPEYRYYKNGVAQAWVALTNTASLTGILTLPTDKTKDKVEFQVRAFDGTMYSGYRNSSIFNIKHNAAPTITLNTENNKTLYENDTFKIDGSAIDSDSGDILNVYYRLNSGTSRAIATGIREHLFRLMSN